jgi:hypothetical protein
MAGKPKEKATGRSVPAEKAKSKAADTLLD